MIPAADPELAFAIAEVLIDRPDAEIVMLDQGPARHGYMARSLETDRVMIVLGAHRIGTVTA